jgi:hypothetical protein
MIPLVCALAGNGTWLAYHNRMMLHFFPQGRTIR